MLFWYTPQINRFNGAVTASVEALCITLEKLFSNQMRLWEEVQTLHKEIQKFNAQNALIQGRLQSETHASSQPRQRNSADNPSVQVPLPPDFTFRLQDRFRGSEEETKNKLRKHLDTLQDLRPSALNRPWLDIGTGRGEWVELAKVSGHSITGIDVNPVAGKYCSSRGLPVIQSEALAYLRSQSEESYSVVTLFHVIEHWSLPNCLEVLREIRRVLSDDGFLLIETPHPGHVMTATESFWIDPTHQRPIPIQLLQFTVEYAGLTVESSGEINEAGTPEGNPYGSLPFLAHLNRRFYGPQDYFLLARRAGDRRQQ